MSCCTVIKYILRYFQTRQGIPLMTDHTPANSTTEAYLHILLSHNLKVMVNLICGRQHKEQPQLGKVNPWEITHCILPYLKKKTKSSKFKTVLS